MTRIGKVLVFLLLVTSLQAEMKVDLKISRKIVKLGDPVILQVQVSGNEQVRDVTAPSSPDFEIVSLGTSSNISIINGAISNSFSYNFHLYPKKTGKLTIPAFNVRTASGVQLTAPVDIEIVEQQTQQPSQPGQQSPTPQEPAQPGEGNLFFRIKPSKTRVYPNEPVILQYMLYARVNFTAPFLESEPDFTSVVTENFEPSQNGEKRRVTVDGAEYWEFNLGRRVIYPIKSGTLDLGLGYLRVGEVVRSQRRTRSLFDDFGSVFDDFDKLFEDN
ncbi:MAG: BatD family protein, partial [Candidatus Wallbacteria bacterium]|nr:BatD family protein [Candidatus Wallbacteria bacterium]